MKILNPKFVYHPSSEHNDPNYLRRRFEEIAGPGWNKKPIRRPRQTARPARGGEK